MSARHQEQPPRPAGPGKKWIRVSKVVAGVESEEWVEVDDDEEGGEEDELAWPPRGEMHVLNRDLPRVDGPDKVTGRARYTHDVRLPGMLYARLLLCPHPTAKFELDLEPARAVPGVKEVRLVTEEETLYLGQPIAAVAATTPEAADDGVRAIRARFEPKPFAVTHEQALAENAAPVGKNGNVRADQTKGDLEAVESALAECDAVVEATYRLPVQHHACLETHGVVVDYSGGDQATVYASTQGTFSVHGEVPKLLGLPAGAVTTVVQHMGGGFGGKFGPDLAGRVACELARDLKTPIHLMLTREAEFLTAGNRSGCVQTLKGGAKKDGTLAALSARVDRLGGIGGGSHGGLPYVYAPRVSFLESRAVHTHTDGSRAFRAPGHPQASFAMESLLDELAYALGIDLLAIRKKNLPSGKDGDVWSRQLDLCAQLVGWDEHPHKSAPDASDAPLKTGIGFGISTWGGGGRAECQVEVRIARDGAVTALSGTQDLGTGTRTLVAAIVAEEFGLALDDVVAQIGRSSYGQANGSGGSTTAASLAPAVKDAAHNARAAFFEHLAGALGTKRERLACERGEILERSDSSGAGDGRRWSWEEACATLPPSGLSARGEWKSQLASRGTHGAQAAKVTVDTLTGEIRVVQMVCVQDCGLALNRLATRSQINGGMVQALSYGLLEERVIDPELGLVLNANFEDYKIAGCQEIPEMIAVIDEKDDRAVIGVGEPPVIPGHGAIANAIHNACGVRLREMPLTSDKLLTGLVALREGTREGPKRPDGAGR